MQLGPKLRVLRRAPTPAEAEELQARAFARPAWLEPYAALSYAESGLTDTEKELLERDLAPGARILDVGCGTGREALGFARAGLVVTAVDGCKEALARAPWHERVTYREGRLSTLELAPGSFEAVYVSSDVYGSLPGRANRVAALARLGRAVVPGGRILFPAALAARRGAVAALLAAVSPLERGDGFVPGPSGELLYRHVFQDADEVRGEVVAAGLALERVTASGFFVARAP